MSNQNVTDTLIKYIRVSRCIARYERYRVPKGQVTGLQTPNKRIGLNRYVLGIFSPEKAKACCNS
eukprot:3922754-Pleurochrysis_carterae.AAC.1